MPFKSSKNCLTYSYDSETLIIEPWGNNAFRVRATKLFAFPDEDWALLKSEAPTSAQVTSKDATETITNGNISATVTATGKLTIHNTSTWQPILEEFVRNRKNVLDSSTSALEIEARDFKPIIGADAFHLTARFESLDEDEKIFGMGQYQQSCMNLKGADLELAQRNSQVSCVLFKQCRPCNGGFYQWYSQHIITYALE
jgi:alpha-D-xyloside xylohydrolase